jgi:hypothetical protein
MVDRAREGSPRHFFKDVFVMTSPIKISPALRNSHLLAGVQKRFPTVNNMQTFPVGGAILSIQQIEAELQPIVNAGAAVAPAKAAWQAAVQAQRTADAEGAVFLSALKATVYVLFGNQPDVLADFGLLPKKTTKTASTAIKVVAVARRKATRALREPLTPTQKKELKGSIGATIQIKVPGAATALPAAPPAAAAAASSGMQAAAASATQGGNGSTPHT